MRFDISLSGNAPSGFPADIAYLFMSQRNEEPICAVRKFPFLGPWGCGGRFDVNVNEDVLLPDYLDTVYLSAVEEQFYALETPIDAVKIKTYCEKHRIQYDDPNLSFIVGLAPYGQVALWLYYVNKQYLIGWYKGEKIEVDMEDFFPNNPDISLHKLCEHYLKEEGTTIGFMPDERYFNKLMRQFCYRYNISVTNKAPSQTEELENITVTSVRDTLLDGTFDKLNDSNLLNFHHGGILQKLAIEWTIGKNYFTAYFFFNADEMVRIFERFYGAHPETKTDFIIQINAEKKKFELALYRQGLKEPVLIPESAYQLMVFKNKFEDYRSENYNQPRGAWIW